MRDGTLLTPSLRRTARRAFSGHLNSRLRRTDVGAAADIEEKANPYIKWGPSTVVVVPAGYACGERRARRRQTPGKSEPSRCRAVISTMRSNDREARLGQAARHRGISYTRARSGGWPTQPPSLKATCLGRARRSVP